MCPGTKVTQPSEWGQTRVNTTALVLEHSTTAWVSKPISNSAAFHTTPLPVLHGTLTWLQPVLHKVTSLQPLLHNIHMTPVSTAWYCHMTLTNTAWNCHDLNNYCNVLSHDSTWPLSILRALCRIKLSPVTHVLVDTWMLTVKPGYKLLKVSDDLKWTTNTHVTPFLLTLKA